MPQDGWGAPQAPAPWSSIEVARLPGSFSQDFIESVRSAGDIVRLVSDYVPLKAAGSRMKGLCPFHDEKTPSFSVDPGRQLFYCFGCQAGGDTFKFVQLYEKLSFPEAVEALARRWGVPIPTQGRRADEGPRDRLLRLNDTARGWFRRNLEDGAAGQGCRRYLERRGIALETAARLGLGYALDGWEALRGHLASQRFHVDEAVAGGLVLPRKSGGGHYDRFRNRLIFPIRDVGGRTLAFGGRALGDEEPKYINSPETPAYTKGDHLYGLDLAKEAIRRLGFAIVVEGYLDLAAVVQAGSDNVVASLGTSFTAAQARLLARYCDRVAFSYDGDTAGATATARSLDLLLARGFAVRVVELPAGQDPDDFIRERGAEAYRALVADAPDYIEFIIRRETRKVDPARIEGQVAAVNAVLPHLAKLTSAVERAAWAARLADALSIEDALILQELRAAVKLTRPRIRQRVAAGQPLVWAEARLVALLLQSAQERRRWVEGELDLAELAGCGVRSIVGAIIELARQGASVDCPALLEALEDEADRSLLMRIAFRDDGTGQPTVDDCLAAFRRERLALEGQRLRREIGDLQRRGPADTPPADMDRQLTRLQDLARRRDALC